MYLLVANHDSDWSTPLKNGATSEGSPSAGLTDGDSAVGVRVAIGASTVVPVIGVDSCGVSVT